MSFCPKCGSQVNKEDKFCGKCGTQLSSYPSFVGSANSRFPPKPSTNLGNGIVIGSGITLLILGLIGAFAFNAYYWQQTSALSSQGLPVNPYNATLNTPIEFISLSWAAVFFGIYFLALSVPSQISPVVRAVWSRSDYTARAGNGLITGGFVFTTLSAAQVIRDFYVPDNFGYPQGFVIFILIGVVMMVVGISLRIVSYLRSRKLATKV